MWCGSKTSFALCISPRVYGSNVPMHNYSGLPEGVSGIIERYEAMMSVQILVELSGRQIEAREENVCRRKG